MRLNLPLVLRSWLLLFSSRRLLSFWQFANNITNWWLGIKPPCKDEAKAERAVGGSAVWPVWREALPAFLVVHVVSVRPMAKAPLYTVTTRRYSRHDRSSHWPSRGYKPFPNVWLYSIPDGPNRNCRCSQSGTSPCAMPVCAKPHADSCVSGSPVAHGWFHSTVQ